MEKYLEMKRKANNHYWAQRILTQMGYLYKVMEAEERAVPDQLNDTENWMYEEYKRDGSITETVAKKAEEMLKGLEKDAKRYSMIFAGHAHIDMNWMWGFQETVNLTIDTFQTMLNLMEEYPEFSFSQSQASVYEIIEKYCPSMLPEIRRRVQEGRWEVTASTWVEPDKNMSGTESMSRHILYTKTYLSDLLGISPDSIELDFEPDTFGHSECIPEILNQGGVKYYYHCRGFEKYTLYRWRAPSGKEVLVNRDNAWYLGPVEYDRVLRLPQYSKENHCDVLLYVYGVGDHGGGPTRRDIEKIMDMKQWPFMPNIRFGTFHEFFHEIEKVKENFPVVDSELNFVLTGCYTTQTRIKLANRTGEDKLYDAEALWAASGVPDEMANQGKKAFEQAWRKVLFNQFHDILPGSGVIETREYAMGQFQQAMSYCGGYANRAMKAISEKIDTTLWGGEDCAGSRSEGAGVGYGTGITSGQWGNAGSNDFGFTNAHRGNGDTRVYTLFNTTQYERKELAVVTLWDWEYPEEEISVLNKDMEELPVQILEQGTHYWQHQYIELAFPASVPAFGYNTYCVRRKPLTSEIIPPFTDPRVHRMEDGLITLENDEICGKFDSETMKLVSLVNKRTGEEFIKEPSGYFRFVEEDDVNAMTAWIVGGYTKVVDINETVPVRVIDRHQDGLRKWLTYEMKFRESSLNVKIILDEGSKIFRFEVNADWHEIGRKGKTIPQLQFYAPVGYEVKNYLYDIPAGSKERGELGHDVPGIYFQAAVPEEDRGCMMLTTNCKYGYRGTGQAMTIDLIRGAYDPDPYPELGIHVMNLGLGIQEKAEWGKLLEAGYLFSHFLYPYSNTIHKGEAAAEHSFMKVEGDVKIAAWKLGEADNTWVIRMYHSHKRSEQVKITAERAIVRAEFTDLLERPQGDQTVNVNADGSVKFELPACSIRTIKLAF